MTRLEPNNDHYQQETQCLFLDSLLCEEGDGFERSEEEISDTNCNISNLLAEDLSWEDEELVSLFSNEKETHVFLEENDHNVIVARRGAIELILKVKAYFGFSCLTALLAINYFDRFSCSFQFQNDKPWMSHLAAVTCLSLAAKMEETKVPPLLDIQVDSEYLFEAKTIKKMELFVMSTLRWRMNPVTPFSFLDHIIRRLGLIKSDIHWVFFKKCEALFLSAVCDGRFVRYLPSVLATSTMLHVIHQVEPLNAGDYQNQLFSVLKTTKEKINGCYELIGNISNNCWIDQKKSHKRKYEEIQDTQNGTINVF